MKLIFLSPIYLLLLTGCVSTLTPVKDGTYSLFVREGSISVTQARCVQHPCPTTISPMSGSFEATISNNGKTIAFTSSSVETESDQQFELPNDPNEDGGGVTRDFSFSFSGESMKGKGVVDSRAFDGPLVEYSFIANKKAPNHQD